MSNLPHGVTDQMIEEQFGDDSCRTCDGLGTIIDKAGIVVDCPKCGGEGTEPDNEPDFEEDSVLGQKGR